ncbi:hypothetical protein ACFQ5D_16615 [Paenibacillus farraposensis]|uniref:Uncharacterized protein n=1 Tax=Paenibacillus farraposensis TaxID=2807095 RepID=A0ABW4DGU1_9BACL|nr:hypothetical protein [Paenibacillus farraposensis]
MKMKKTAIILTSVLALTVVAPVAAFATPSVDSNGSSSTLEQKGQPTVINADEIAAAAAKIEPYIILGEDGLYTLDTKAKDVVGEEKYDKLAKAFEQINTEIKAGYLSTATGDITVTAKGNSHYNNQFSTNAFSNVYPWGVAITLSHSETQNQIAAMEASGSAAGFLSLLLSTIPGGQGPALGGAIFGAGAGLLAQVLKIQDKGRGITVNLMWTGWSITSN